MPIYDLENQATGYDDRAQQQQAPAPYPGMPTKAECQEALAVMHLEDSPALALRRKYLADMKERVLMSMTSCSPDELRIKQGQFHTLAMCERILDEEGGDLHEFYLGLLKVFYGEEGLPDA